MNFEQIINSLDRSWRIFDSNRINLLGEVLNWLENPDSNFKTIHIAGTNGKGSVGAIISTILSEQDFKVGHFSSPYVVSDLEQITINQKQISEEQFVDIYKKILKTLEKHQQTSDYLSYFEWMTLIALCFFEESKIDFAVIEVGVGGVDDATNILTSSQMEVFTKITLDHTDLLGDSIEEITEKKAQIIKQGSYVVVDSKMNETASKIIREVAIKKQAIIVDTQLPKITLINSNPTGLDLTIDNLQVHLNLFGNYQIDNLMTSLITIKQLEKLNDFIVTDETLVIALNKVKIEKRDYYDQEDNILYSSSHNFDGINGLVETIQSWNLKVKPNLILGILKDKNYQSMIDKIAPIVGDIICVTPAYPNQDRVLTANQLAKEITDKLPDKQVSIANLESVVTNNQQFTIATGSIYTLRALQNDK